MAKKSKLKPSTNTKYKWVLLIASIIFLALVLNYIQTKHLTHENLTRNTPPPSITIMATKAATPGEYNNYYLGLSFMYPKEWKVENSYTSNSNTIEIYNPDTPKFGYIPRIIIIRANNKLVNNLTGGYPYSVDGIQANRWSNPSGSQVANEIVQFEKNGYYYNFTLMWDDSKNPYNKYNKGIVQEFNNMLSTFQVVK